MTGNTLRDDLTKLRDEMRAGLHRNDSGFRPSLLNRIDAILANAQPESAEPGAKPFCYMQVQDWAALVCDGEVEAALITTTTKECAPGDECYPDVPLYTTPQPAADGVARLANVPRYSLDLSTEQGYGTFYNGLHETTTGDLMRADDVYEALSAAPSPPRAGDV